jgi:hypothetical protein
MGLLTWIEKYKLLDVFVFLVMCCFLYGVMLYYHYHHIKERQKPVEGFENLLDAHHKSINDAIYGSIDKIKDSVSYVFGKKGYLTDTEDIYDDSDDELDDEYEDGEGDGFQEYCDDSPYPIWFLKGVQRVKDIMPQTQIPIPILGL